MNEKKLLLAFYSYMFFFKSNTFEFELKMYISQVY